MLAYIICNSTQCPKVWEISDQNKDQAAEYASRFEASAKASKHADKETRRSPTLHMIKCELEECMSNRSQFTSWISIWHKQGPNDQAKGKKKTKRKTLKRTPKYEFTSFAAKPIPEDQAAYVDTPVISQVVKEDDGTEYMDVQECMNWKAITNHFLNPCHFQSTMKYVYVSASAILRMYIRFTCDVIYVYVCMCVCVCVCVANKV